MNLTHDEIVQYADDESVVTRQQLVDVVKSIDDKADEVKNLHRNCEILEEQLYFARELLNNVRLLTRDEKLSVAKLRKAIEVVFENSMMDW